MKIGLVNEYFPPFAPGGAEWSMLTLAQFLAQMHQVTIITPNYGAAEFENLNGLRVYRFKYRAKIEANQTTVRYRWLANPIFYLHSARQIEKIARREQLDILHAQNKYSLPGAWLAARRLSIPVIYTIRDVSMICPFGQCFIKYGQAHPRCGQWGHWWRDCRPTYLAHYFPNESKKSRLNLSFIWLWLDTRFRRWFLRRLNGVIGVSEGILQVHQQAGVLANRPTQAIYNIPPEQTVVSNQALVDLKTRLGLTHQKVILYAGRFSLGKGTQDLVEAADNVIAKVPQALFLFAGQGDIVLNGSHTQSLGRVSHDELWRLYHLADLVVIPSRQPEPLTRVALEAMTAGCALVGTRVGGTPELIEHERNGLLVEPGNPTQLAQAIIHLLRNDDLRGEMVQAGRELIQTRFAAQATLGKLEDFYRQAIITQKGRFK